MSWLLLTEVPFMDGKDASWQVRGFNIFSPRAFIEYCSDTPRGFIDAPLSLYIDLMVVGKRNWCLTSFSMFLRSAAKFYGLRADLWFPLSTIARRSWRRSFSRCVVASGNVTPFTRMSCNCFQFWVCFQIFAIVWMLRNSVPGVRHVPGWSCTALQ